MNHRSYKNGWRTIAVLLVVYLCTGVADGGGLDDILIVSNKSVDQKSISLAEVRSIFLKEKTRWKDGQKIIVLNAKRGSPLRKAFQDRLLSMEPEEEYAYWEEQKIRRQLSAPTEFANLLKAVFKLKGAIGYVYRHQYKEGVANVLMVLPDAGSGKKK